MKWNDSGMGEFTGGIKLIGEDRAGILNELTNAISKKFKTNIKVS